MKTFRFLLLFIYTALFTVSCTENRNSNLELASDVNIGIIHNEGLDYMKNKLNSSLKTRLEESAYVSSETLFDFALEYCTSIPEYENLGSLNIDKSSLITVLDDVRSDMTIEKISSIWTSKINDIFQIHILSPLENNAVSEFKQIFMDASSLSVQAQYNYISDKIAEMKLNYEDLYINSELFSGLLDIGSESNNYWLNYISQFSTRLSGDEECQEQDSDKIEKTNICIVVKLDCLGYIVGWVGAVWNEYHSTGGLKTKNQWARIGTGLISAAGFSGARLISETWQPEPEEPQVVQEDPEEPQEAPVEP